VGGCGADVALDSGSGVAIGGVAGAWVAVEMPGAGKLVGGAVTVAAGRWQADNHNARQIRVRVGETLHLLDTSDVNSFFIMARISKVLHYHDIAQ
jgi:hypothetical protein